MPTFRTDKSLKQGDFDYYTSDSGIYVVKCKDKRCVHLISNYHNPNSVTSVKRKDKTGKKEDVPCPTILVDYNAHMNSVDKLDQMKSTYELDRKSRKWWHRIVFYFFDICVVNSFVIYKKLELPPKTMKDFKREISRSLVTPLINQKKRKSLNIKATPTQIKKHKP